PTPRGSPTTNGRRSSVNSSRARSAASPPFSACPIPRPSRSRPTPTTSSAGSSPRCRRARRRALSPATAQFLSSRAPLPARREAGFVAADRTAAEPFASFAERFATAARRGGHDLVFVSQIFFNSAGACGSLDAIAAAVRDPQTLVAFDGYHGFMALPTGL